MMYVKYKNTGWMLTYFNGKEKSKSRLYLRKCPVTGEA